MVVVVDKEVLCDVSWEACEVDRRMNVCPANQKGASRIIFAECHTQTFSQKSSQRPSHLHHYAVIFFFFYFFYH